MRDYDVIFIGSGHACNHGAIMLKMAGKKVAMVIQGKSIYFRPIAKIGGRMN